MNKISLQQQHQEIPQTLAHLMFVIIQPPLLMNNLAISRNEARLTELFMFNMKHWFECMAALLLSSVLLMVPH